MSTFTFVFLVVCVSLVAWLINTWLEQRKERRHTDQETGEVEHMVARLDALQERIEVLERIVTDSPVDLKRKIDSL